MLPLLSCLPSVDPDTSDLIAVVETPKASPNKYKFEQKFGAFVLNTVMPKGSFFPYDFGFIPSTLGEDGDPSTCWCSWIILLLSAVCWLSVL